MIPRRLYVLLLHVFLRQLFELGSQILSERRDGVRRHDWDLSRSLFVAVWYEVNERYRNDQR
jgi:hypothetical protein